MFLIFISFLVISESCDETFPSVRKRNGETFPSVRIFVHSAPVDGLQMAVSRRCCRHEFVSISPVLSAKFLSLAAATRQSDFLPIAQVWRFNVGG